MNGPEIAVNSDAGGFRWVAGESGALQLFAGRLHIASISAFVSQTIRYDDELEAAGEGIFRWTRRFTPASANPAATPQLSMELIALHEASYCLIPAVSYNGNNWGSGAEPKGFSRDGVPWSFAWHRVALPGATYAEGPLWSIALFGAVPPPGADFSCSLIPEPDRTTHRLTWPEAERPAVYCGRDRYSPAYAGSLRLDPGTEFVAVAYIVVSPVTMPRTAPSRLLNAAWALNYHDVVPSYSPEMIWDFGIRYIKESLWAAHGEFCALSIGLTWEGDRWHQRQQGEHEIGWCGQNISLANALLHDYLKTLDISSRDMGIAVLDTWAGRARLDCGLVRCHLQAPTPAHMQGGGPPPEETQDACNLGGAAVAFFAAAQLAAECGVERPHYYEIALGICDFVVQAQTDSGRIGRAWKDDGTCIDPNGTIGCFLVPPLIAAYERTGQERYLMAAEKGCAYYVAGFLHDGFTTAGALDTHCIDKESALPLLTASLDLYALSGKVIYLRWAEQVSLYQATWQWHYSIPYPSESPLAKLGYDTFGGTSVSTQHHHLDPYAVSFVPSWLRLAEITGDNVWRQRARAAWAHGMIGVSDGDLVVMGKRRPVGSQDEGAFHTRWGRIGELSEWLVAWPTAFRLDVLRTLPDWSVLR